MALQYSVAVRNAQLDAWETAIGASPIIRLYDGANPADCATAPTAAIIANGTAAADWSAAAAAGQKTILNGPVVITGITAAGTGTAVVAYRIYDSAGTTCHEQGTVTATNGIGDMTMDNVSIADTQTANLNTQTRICGNA